MRFGMPGSHQARSVGLRGCSLLQHVHKFQSEVHSLTIPRTRDQLVELVLAPLQGVPGAGVLNK